MSRPIKFRALRDDGTWLYSDDKLSRFWASVDNGYVHYETVGQFTGLLDKNGKEIYIGDILVTSNASMRLGEDRWEPLDMGHTIVGSKTNELGIEFSNWEVGDSGDMDNMFHPRFIEVIGNIYENP